MLETAGDRYELVRPPAQFLADILNDQVEVAIATDHSCEDLTRDRLRCGEDDRLDTSHPFTPARRRRQIIEIDIKARFRLGAACHGYSP